MKLISGTDVLDVSDITHKVSLLQLPTSVNNEYLHPTWASGTLSIVALEQENSKGFLINALFPQEKSPNVLETQRRPVVWPNVFSFQHSFALVVQCELLTGSIDRHLLRMIIQFPKREIRPWSCRCPSHLRSRYQSNDFILIWNLNDSIGTWLPVNNCHLLTDLLNVWWLTRGIGSPIGHFYDAFCICILLIRPHLGRHFIPHYFQSYLLLQNDVFILQSHPQRQIHLAKISVSTHTEWLITSAVHRSTGCHVIGSLAMDTKDHPNGN